MFLVQSLKHPSHKALPKAPNPQSGLWQKWHHFLLQLLVLASFPVEKNALIKSIYVRTGLLWLSLRIQFIEAGRQALEAVTLHSQLERGKQWVHTDPWLHFSNCMVQDPSWSMVLHPVGRPSKFSAFKTTFHSYAQRFILQETLDSMKLTININPHSGTSLYNNSLICIVWCVK